MDSFIETVGGADETRVERPASCPFAGAHGRAQIAPAPQNALAIQRPRFRPPVPARPQGRLPLLRLLAASGRNLLSVWPDFTYASDSFSFKILGRCVHVVSTPDTVREVFVDKAPAVADKTWQQRHVLRPLAGDGLIISNGELWQTRRKKIAPVTHISQMPSLARSMSAGAARQARAWIERGDGFEVDLVGEMGRLAAGIVTSAMFGRDADPAIIARIVRDFHDYQASAKQLDILTFFGAFDPLPRFAGFRAGRAARAIRRDLDQLIEAAVQGPRGVPFLEPFYATREDGAEELDRAACRNEAAVMLLAGHETTANTLAWAFYLLSQDPVSERRLHDEVDRTVSGEAAGFDDLSALPFTRAVIQETLRLYPPVPLQARRAVHAFEIGQKTVAAGDIVVLNAWILHRHRRHWDDPDAFVPERFLPGEAEPPSRYAYVPFGIGPRVCTGAAFGQTEAIICLATLARRFRLRPPPGTQVVPVCKLSLRPGHRLPMIVQQRV